MYIAFIILSPPVFVPHQCGHSAMQPVGTCMNGDSGGRNRQLPLRRSLHSTGTADGRDSGQRRGIFSG